jgi:predicted ribosomally synthesized peptide with SipW-like signal peptide
VREILISRRGALGGLVAVGAAAAGAGLGTRALFSDSESFTNNSVTAGELDLEVAWRKTVVQGTTTTEETSGDFPTPTDEVDAPICDLSDVKPGDNGHIEFVLRIDGNPGYLSLVGAEQVDRENGQPEPERGALRESVPAGREGELDELLETTVSYGTVPDDLGNSEINSGEAAYTASLASLIDLGSVGTGVPLDGAGSESVTDIVLDNATPDPFAPGTRHGLRVDFAVPTTVGNGVQSDSYEFAVGLYSEQARNNDL